MKETFREYLFSLLKEEWEIYTLIGKICIFLPWLIRSFLILLSTPIIYAFYKFLKSEKYFKLERIFINAYLDYVTEISKNK